MKGRLLLIGLMGWVLQTHATPLLQETREKVVKLSPPVKAKVKAQPSLSMKEIKLFTDHIAFFNASELQALPVIISHNAHSLYAAKGDEITVNKLVNPSVKDYFVIDTPKAYTDPASKTVLGYSALVRAKASVKQAGTPAILQVTHSFRELKSGARLWVKPIATKQKQLNLYKPQQPINAAILAIINKHVGAKNDVIVIDKGAQDGLTPGALLKIQAQKNPEKQLGEAVITKTLPHLSLGLITQSTGIIATTDRVAN